MPDNRNGEPPERHFRSNRVVMARGRWYVVTRERLDVGPYDTKEAAESAATQMGLTLDGVDDPTVALALIGKFRRRTSAASD